jgi:hypothetical protein
LTYRHEDKIKTHEDEITLPCKIVDQSWPYHGHEEIPEPICRDPEGLAILGVFTVSFVQIPQGPPFGMKLLCLPFSSDMKGEDLRPVNPWYAVNGRPKDEHKQEEKWH